MYARPAIVIIFLTIKFVIDYLMFEGVERFSLFSERINLQILTAIEIFYVIMSNFMIYSIFYADFALPLKVIIQFSVLNLILIILAIGLLIVIENVMCDITVVIALHVISIILYYDKCSALIKCGIYNAIGKTLIYVTMVFKLLFDHFFRIFYISNLLINFTDPSLIRDRILFLIQILFTCLLLFVFLFYRRHNSELLGPVFAAEKKIGGKQKSQRLPESNFVFENAAEELMFPAENELNTISDIASDDEGELDVEEELRNQQLHEPVVSASPVVSSREPSIFATGESGRSRRHEHRIQIIRRTLNRAPSIECYHPSTL
ncbi:hypothetical protein GCK72_017415 [Caenorhabditis remanei]|uniref:Uncharacterized protein n=1 Tax=Caenorhabditis remanei TaxID=31234 RepID=A0A6A5G8F4_CAERE|nr:hypothetical protein GCK72_017415 [Caenorhabditis remanei]KAF1750864.1 hypothetical protein GCK72_017415 [Caenorhabditis remanei]